MKKVRKLAVLIVSLMMVCSITGYGQQKKSDTLVIKSSVVCGQCKDRVEGALAFEKGVKSSDVDLEQKTIKIIFNPSKTTPEKLRTIITKLGYDADDMLADKAAYDRLPACCKKDAPQH